MRNDKTYSKPRSVLYVLSKPLLVFGGVAFIWFVLPLVSFNINVSDKIDIWVSNPVHQSKIALGVFVIGFVGGVYWVVKKVS
jgi:hypothetical protein